MRRVFLVAGEPSGDALGAALMAGLKQLSPGSEFAGVGGPLMEAEGMESLFPMSELSVMGLAEVLPRYPHLLRRMKQTADTAIEQAPDVLITIDSPDFSLRVAQRIKASAPQIRTVHYVAPTVWAWRAGRARKMAKMIDQVLALFPFEPPYMEAEGMRCDFVGHPVAATPPVPAADIAALRDRLGLGADAPYVLALPGSRRSEVERLSDVFGTALHKVVARHPALNVVLPAAPAVADTVRRLSADWPQQLKVLDIGDLPKDEGLALKRAAFAGATAALAASGTVSLELAAARTPMVIGYDMNWLTRQIMGRMVKVDSVTLVNIVTGTHAVPEFLGPACTADALSEALLALLDDAGARQAQLDAADETIRQLGQGGEAPGLRAARAVLDGLGG